MRASACAHFRRLGALCLWLLCACGPSRARVEIDIRLPEGAQVEPARIGFAPSGHVFDVRLERTGGLRLATDGAALTVRIAGLCPIEVPASRRATRAVALRAVPLLSFPTTLAQLGFDAPFAFRVQPGCDEAKRARLRWRQVEGLPLADLTVHEQGRSVQGRTLPLSAYFPQGLPDGVVPVSPRTQGRSVLEALPEGVTGMTAPLRVVISASARATGLPSVAVSQRVLLGGAGWRVARVPPGSRAQLSAGAGASSFQPDVPGRFELVDGAGHKLELSALTHDLTPLDCGRAECHAALSQAARESPMSRAFELPFAHGAARLDQQGCMLDCHVVGEVGLHDGGFRDLAQRLGQQLTTPVRADELPHALQRLAGVRCTSCHGPGAVPPQAGRSRILRADVCATCHDAPPAYNQVAQWRASRMAQSDANADARSRPECAQCHTTGGFLHGSGVRPRADLSRDAEGAVVGISCAACHAPHGAHVGRALVRALAPPARVAAAAWQNAGASSVCAACHSPVADQDAPAASSAALWLGQITLPGALGGETLAGQAPHREHAGGCVSCHGRRAAQAKLDHSFKVDPALCTASCHDEQARTRWSADKQALRTRAEALWSALAKACGPAPALGPNVPPHAQSAQSRCRTPGLARARYLLALVVEDGAAFEHNASFARELLGRVEAALSGR